jgi:hypothetical protein
MFSGNFISITKVKNMVLNILVFRCLNGRTGDFESNYKKYGRSAVILILF